MLLNIELKCDVFKPIFFVYFLWPLQFNLRQTQQRDVHFVENYYAQTKQQTVYKSTYVQTYYYADCRIFAVISVGKTLAILTTICQIWLACKKSKIEIRRKNWKAPLHTSLSDYGRVALLHHKDLERKLTRDHFLTVGVRVCLRV